MLGGNGNDFLEGGAGDDPLTGGDGNDTYIFDPLSGDGGDLGHDTINEATSSASDTLDFSNFADDQGIGTSGTPFNLATTSSQTVHSGVLTLTLQYSTSIENLIGSSGDDYITGNTQGNILDGRGGDDTLIGSDGDDRLYGGDGDDQVQGNAGSDALYGGDGDDHLWGGTDKDYLYGGAGGDTLDDYDHSGSTTNGGNDHLDGGDGLDNLHGRDGDDELIGGAGDDDLHGDSGDDHYIYSWHQEDYGLGSDIIYEDTSAGDDKVDLSNFYDASYLGLDLGSDDLQVVSDRQTSDPLRSSEDQIIRDSLHISFNTASTVEDIMAPDSLQTAVRGLVVDFAGNDSRLVAQNVIGNASTVAFFYDSNSNGIWDSNDVALGYDSDKSDGWKITVPYNEAGDGWMVDDGVTVNDVHFNPADNSFFAFAVGPGIDDPGDTGVVPAVTEKTPPTPVKPPVQVFKQVINAGSQHVEASAGTEAVVQVVAGHPGSDYDADVDSDEDTGWTAVSANATPNDANASTAPNGTATASGASHGEASTLGGDKEPIFLQR
jgi:Ca2+-binding RTX toxin-like protein